MNPTKIDIQECKYGCGKKIYWNPNIKISKIKFMEFDTGILHDYPRCAQLLKQQGKDLVK